MWIHEAIVRFLQGPCYSVPLMGSIDENCAIFDKEVCPAGAPHPPLSPRYRTLPLPPVPQRPPRPPGVGS